jgi:predicted nucleotidyltransferase
MAMLTDLFRTEEREKILSCTLDRPACTVQEIADATGITKGLVSRYLASLAGRGILARDGRTYHLQYTAMTRHLKKILNIERLHAAIPLPAWADGIGVYGSFAQGTNTIKSDLDLWVRVRDLPPELTGATAEREWSKILNLEIHLLILTPEKIHSLAETDKPFWQSFTLDAIVLEGTGYDRYL